MIITVKDQLIDDTAMMYPNSHCLAALELTSSKNKFTHLNSACVATTSKEVSMMRMGGSEPWVVYT